MHGCPILCTYVLAAEPPHSNKQISHSLQLELIPSPFNTRRVPYYSQGEVSVNASTEDTPGSTRKSGDENPLARHTFLGSAVNIAAAPGSATTWFVRNTATLNSSAAEGKPVTTDRPGSGSCQGVGRAAAKRARRMASTCWTALLPACPRKKNSPAPWAQNRKEEREGSPNPPRAPVSNRPPPFSTEKVDGTSRAAAKRLESGRGRTEADAKPMTMNRGEGLHLLPEIPSTSSTGLGEGLCRITMVLPLVLQGTAHAGPPLPRLETWSHTAVPCPWPRVVRPVGHRLPRA